MGSGKKSKSLGERLRRQAGDRRTRSDLSDSGSDRSRGSRRARTAANNAADVLMQLSSSPAAPRAGVATSPVTPAVLPDSAFCTSCAMRTNQYLNMVLSPGTSSCRHCTASRQLPSPPPPPRFDTLPAPRRGSAGASPSTPRPTMASSHLPAVYPRTPSDRNDSHQRNARPTQQRLLPFHPRADAEPSRSQGPRSTGQVRRSTDLLSRALHRPSSSRAGPSRGAGEGAEASPSRSSRSARAPPVGSPGRSGQGERRAKHKCTWTGCDASYTTQGDLTRHVNEHHLKRAPFRCEDCGRAMTRKSSLARHKGSPACKEEQKKNRG